MPCCKTTDTWVKNLRTSSTGDEFKQYAVQVVRDISCCSEKYHIFVNGVEIEHHTLSYNPCSPLCCSGGMYEWEQDGHSFMVMYNSLSFTRAWGGFRLFIDGRDANTDREINSYWRRRGLQVIFMGICFLVVGIALSLLFRYAFDERVGTYAYWIGYSFVCSGVIYVIMGIIPFLRKYPTPRYGNFANVPHSEQTPNVV